MKLLLAILLLVLSTFATAEEPKKPKLKASEAPKIALPKALV